MKWNEASVKEEARKYSSRTEFKYGSSGAYKWAVREGLYEYVVAHMPKKGGNKYARQRVVELAANFVTLRDFVAAHPTAASTAFKNGYYDVLDHLERVRVSKPKVPE